MDAEASSEAAGSPVEAGNAGPPPPAETPGGQAPPADAKPPAEKPRPTRVAQAIADTARREREARAKEDSAKALEAKLAPLESALTKRDLRKAIEHMAETYGVGFGDFVAAFEQGDEEEATPEQIARRVVEDELGKRRAEEETKRKKADEDAAAAETKRHEELRAKVDADLAKMAEDGGDRWELTDIAGKAPEAWDIIEGHFIQTCTRNADGTLNHDGEKLTFEAALDLIETKLKQKRDAKKQRATGQAEQKRNGEAVEPTLNNRNSSSVPGASMGDDEEPESQSAAIERAARRANIKL